MRTRILGPTVLIVALAALAGCSGPIDNPLAGPTREQGEVRSVAGRSDLASSERTGLAAEDATDSSAPPMRVRIDTYADDVCSGLERFGASYRQARAERREALYGSPHKAKWAMIGYIDAIDTALERAIVATTAWGVPDVANGERLAKKVHSALENAQQVNYSYRPQFVATSSKDRQFTTMARALLVESEAELSTALLKLDWFDDAGSDFRKAFNQSRSCGAL